MKEKFVNHRITGEKLELTLIAETILDGLKSQGYTATLRQLYYQLVTKNIIPNSEKSYQSLSILITRGREAGIINWNAIEDRGRTCNSFSFEEDERTIFEGLEYCMRYDYWQRQEHYVEVWVEKDALFGVIEKPCKRFLVPHMACKGYLSASAAYNSGKRFREALDNGKKCVLLHLGDHDPSGIDMTRDNGDRVHLFGSVDTYIDENVEVRRIALNRDQIDQYNPPPNPAKFKDPRAADYIRQHGRVSWELDALTPKVLDDLISKNINRYIDADAWEEVREAETLIRKKIATLPELHDDIFKMIDDHLEPPKPKKTVKKKKK